MPLCGSVMRPTPVTQAVILRRKHQINSHQLLTNLMRCVAGAVDLTTTMAQSTS